jgi:hypothetical protein
MYLDCWVVSPASPADDSGRVVSRKAVDGDPIHEHVVWGLREQAVGSVERSEMGQQAVDRGAKFEREGFVAGMVVVFHDHLQPQEGVAGVEVNGTGVVEDLGEFAKVLPSELLLVEGVVVFYGLDEVVAEIAEGLLVVGRVEVMVLHADLGEPAGGLPELVKLVV